MLHRVHLVCARFELTMLVEIDTDCTGSCKINYHTITITTTASPNILLPDLTMSTTVDDFSEAGIYYPSWTSPSPFLSGVRVVHVFSFLCCEFVLSVFVLCFVSILPVSLVCPLLIVPSVFSNVYLHAMSWVRFPPLSICTRSDYLWCFLSMTSSYFLWLILPIKLITHDNWTTHNL